jgi:phosphoglycolate phosphatase-like HAD superfamily hydrolase
VCAGGSGGDDLKKAIIFYREYFSAKGAYENKLYPDVYDMLENLYKNNKKLFLVTTKAKQFAVKILEYFNIKEFFKNVYGSDLHSFDTINKSKEAFQSSGKSKYYKKRQLRFVHFVKINSRVFLPLP